MEDVNQFNLHNTFINNPMPTSLNTNATSCSLFLDPFTLPVVPLLDWTLPEIGDEPLVQTFFEGPIKCTCCINWVEKAPKEIPIEFQEKYQKAAIRVYKCKDHHIHDATKLKPTTVVGGLTTSITIMHIEIQSPIIRREIGPILAEGGRETLNTETIKVFRPFQELYFSHSKITEILKNQKDGTKGREHMKVMVDVMDEIFSEVIPEVSSLHVEKKITQKYLWTLFPKGITAYSRGEDGEDRLFEVVSLSGNCVKCRFLDSYGTTFGWREKNICVTPFSGIKKISSLEVYPVGFHEDKGLEKTLASRGLRVLEYQEIVQCQYVNPSSSSGIVCQKIVVDNFGHNQYSGTSTFVEELWETEKKEHDYREYEDEEEEEDDCNLVRLAPRPASRPSTKQRDATSVRMQQNQQWLRLISPHLRGFSFTAGVWGLFNVDNLEPISWNSGAIDRLVFPEEQKNLLLSFVINYKQSTSYSGDLINGKGKGLVVLLSGPPGTGKTLTVEAVAEKAKRPLFRLSVHSYGALRQILSEASTLATEYGAILLLDGELNFVQAEADVFLRSRSNSRSDERNEMVAEMLRALEYYAGIIFLTTNLLEDIDHAFLSRIHMHLKYPDLSASSRLAIWKDILHQKPDFFETTNTLQPNGDRDGSDGVLAQVEISDDDLHKLACWQLNGREIKNVIKVGRLWCLYNKYPLRRSRLETVITICGPTAVRNVSLSDDETVQRKRARVEE